MMMGAALGYDVDVGVVCVFVGDVVSVDVVVDVDAVVDECVCHVGVFFIDVDVDVASDLGVEVYVEGVVDFLY